MSYCYQVVAINKQSCIIVVNFKPLSHDAEHVLLHDNNIIVMITFPSSLH